MRMRGAAYVLLCAVYLTWACQTDASSVVALGIDQLVGWSDTIVGGTVTATRTEWSADRTTIHTHVTFRELSLVKGGSATADSLTLAFEGGQIGEARLVGVGIPQFQLGERAVLFLALRDTAAVKICPTVGLFQGKFQVLNRGEQDEVVLDSHGREIIGFEDGNLVVLGHDSTEMTGAPGVTISEAADFVLQRPPAGVVEERPTSSASVPPPRKLVETVAEPEPRPSPPPPRPHARLVQWGYTLPKVIDPDDAPPQRVDEGSFLAWISDALEGAHGQTGGNHAE